MSDKKLQKQLMGASALVIEMSVLILAAAFAGAWGDRQLHCSPLLLILGIFGGLALGMFRLIQTINTLNHNNEPPHPDNHP